MYGPHGGRSRTSIIALFIVVMACSYFLLHLMLSPLQPAFRLYLTSPNPPPPTYHNYTSPFSFDLDRPAHRSWMSLVPDHASLASVSIPGTHDTQTYDLVDNPVYQTQKHDLRAQLAAGLRYFDIRGRLLINESAGAGGDDPVIGIFHGGVYTGYTFEDVLLTLFGFLEEYPGEGVIMRLKQEGSPVRVSQAGVFIFGGEDDDVNNENDAADSAGHTTFEEAFNHYRLGNAHTSPGSTRHLLLPWPPSTSTSISTTAGAGDGDAPPLPVFPTMGQMRGRILVLQEFPSVRGPYGVPWRSPHISLEDLWIIPTPEHLEDKWDAIRGKLEEAGASAEGSDVLFLSHLSASIGVLPIEAAAGPLAMGVNGTAIVGMNDRTGLWLEEGGGDGRGRGVEGKTGVVMADFPGQRLVDAVIKRNAWLMDG